MTRGIIYVMSSIVDGLIKIGKSETYRFDGRMADIERDGYHNVAGFKREFAIEVDNYDFKEKLLHRVLRNCRIGKSELFSLELEEAIQLLSALDGKPVYPENAIKEDVFVEASENLEETDPTKEDVENIDENKEDAEVADEIKKNKSGHKFKETHFSSSLTGKKYYFPESVGTLKLYCEETNEEIKNHSSLSKNNSPSKRQIMQQAILDLQPDYLPENFKGKTSYEYAHILEKLVGNNSN